MNNKITYAHLRCLDVQGNLSPFGGVTLAMQECEGGITELGVAVCHANDHYVKKEGRNRAAGRLVSKAPALARFRAETKLSVKEIFGVFDGTIRDDKAIMELYNICHAAGVS